jgi:putative FmdB family regulatory protein
MPVYEYVCDSCGKATELLRAMREADAPVQCEHCGGRKTKRAQSVVTVASGTSGGGKESSLPMAGCGRCGDPRGSCGLS